MKWVMHDEKENWDVSAACLEQNTMSDHTVEKLTGHISGMAAERIKYAEQSG